MPCTCPIDGWFSKERTENGKRQVVFRMQDGLSDLPVTVPCGQCIGCRLEYARSWAIRCMHEASMHDDNSFITLTYEDEHLPPFASLDKRHFQLFMKRLRATTNERIRYFHCGEYGSRTHRPHYHSLLFGFAFSDQKPWTRRADYQVWRSETLERLWPYGQSEIGSVTWESAAYVARYVVKKFRGTPEQIKDHYAVVDTSTGEILGHRQPEYATMSRRPGLGAPWYDYYGEGVRKHDSVIINGKEVKPPRYYMQLFENASPDACRHTKFTRRLKGDQFREKDGRGDARYYAEQKTLEAREALFMEDKI